MQMFANVRQEIVDTFEENLSIAEEYGYKPSSYGVRGDCNQVNPRYACG